MHALIVAGGQGTRLWPVSRQNKPKQLLKLIGNQTLLESTFARLRKGFSTNHIFVATTASYVGQIRKQLPKIPKDHYSVEPVLRDRGPAIGLAALIMRQADPESSFVTAWSDHYIKNERAYFKVLKQAEEFLSSHPDTIITIGIIPSHAHLGFGYIETGRPIAGQEVLKARSFTEKPDLETAERFVACKTHLWNTGYFVSKTATLLSLYEQHLPAVYKVLMKIKPYIGTKNQQEAINKFYPLMPSVDIEKGLMEKLDNVAVIPADFGWVDIGSWKTIHEILPKNGANLTTGNVMVSNSEDNLIYNFEDKLVATAGIKDLIIINTKDALLVADKRHSEQIKELVKKLKSKKRLQKYL